MEFRFALSELSQRRDYKQFHNFSYVDHGSCHDATCPLDISASIWVTKNGLSNILMNYPQITTMSLILSKSTKFDNPYATRDRTKQLGMKIYKICHHSLRCKRAHFHQITSIKHSKKHMFSSNTFVALYIHCNSISLLFSLLPSNVILLDDPRHGIP